MKWPWSKEQQELNLSQELLEARASLARLELLPAEDFTVQGSGPFMPLVHGIDNKPKVIARKKAEIARLEILTAEEHPHGH